MAWLNPDDVVKSGEGKNFKPIFAIDFDNTICESEYPAMGRPNEGAIEVLRELIAAGVRIVLNTMRTGKELNDAVVYCNRNYIDLFGINENPEQDKWSTSTKLFAHVYIDDRGAGTPLRRGSNDEACVDWAKLRLLFVEWEILEPLEATDPNKQSFKIA